MFDWPEFLSYVVMTAITPGPNNILSMSNAARCGLRKSYPLNLGILLGFSIISVLCAVLCSILSSLVPIIKTPMLFIGAAYMLCLAWKTFRASDLIDDDKRRGSFRSGLVLQFVNIKVLIYCIMSMEMYIVPYYQGQWPALILFALLLSFVGFVSTIIWALFGSLLKKLFSKYAKITNTIMALILVYLAIALFL